MIEESKSAIVILACNTLSSLIFHYNLRFKKTVVDVITPTIYFLRKRNYQNITILATKNTKFMDVYSKLLSCNINYIDATDLIEEIETGNVNEITIKNIIEVIPKSSELLVLGCTHLIKIKDIIKELSPIEILSQDEVFIDFLNENI